MATTYNVIALGVLADLDTTEGNNSAENASALVGMTFGGVGDPLLDYFVSFSPGSTGFAGGHAQRYDQDNSPNEAFSIDGGVDQIFDSAVRYDATVTYVDGSTDTLEIVIFQDTSGNSYIAPEINPGANQDALEFGAIRSVTIDGVRLSNTTGLVADREVFNFVTCFTEGAQIATPNGDVPIQELSVGDLILTRDSGAKPIRWIGRTTRTATGALIPIRIAVGALGQGLPRADVVVSQQHRMLVSSKIAESLTGCHEVLVAAKKLLLVPGVELAEDVKTVTYLHLLLDRHEIIYVEGAPTESLMTGPQACKAIGPEAMAELETLFPRLLESASEPARQIPKGKTLGRLVYRHWRNQKPVLQM